ncbi:MAG: ABC transporter substrate-binding protein [Deltaproteobacteria bacterium]|nr:ABC transporter substrate-binding protein [Deltaproteobacteria bacterium]
MKRGIITIFAALFLVWGISSSVMAAEPYRIGALCPFTGNLALLGNESFNGAVIAQDLVNEKGGVKGRKIEWVKADGVDPKKAMTECERLIAVEKTKIIFGTYSSSLAYAASEVSERNKIIYWEEGAIADKITARGFKYIFRTISRAGDCGVMAANFVQEVVAPKLKMDPKKIKVGIMFEDSLYGSSVGDAAVKRAKELGLDVVASESYSAKTVDLSSIVMIFKSKRPDVIIATSYMEDSILFWRQAKDMDLNVKVFIGTGAGHGMPDWAKTFGNEGNYIFNIDPPIGINPKAFKGNTQALSNDFRERFNKKFGHYPAVHATAGFVSAQVLFEAIRIAGTDDPEAVRKAALTIDIPEGESIFGFGVKFAGPEDPSAGQNLKGHPVLMQWLEQKLAVVYPKAFAIAEPLIPLPTWEERAKGKTNFVK